ncbi:MAG: type II toxin-antitoxin system RelE/ParE family toxin [Desulfobulbus sp.]|nr:type II toxin-antitoxin system RelE/ParE family toxin [Desulfobulbus sp.]
MKYELKFKEEAFREWNALDGSIREIFKKKLKERLADPKVPSAKLRTMSDCYKIKLRGPGYRLVYQVRDNELVIVVIAVGKRDKNQVYKIASSRV